MVWTMNTKKIWQLLTKKYIRAGNLGNISSSMVMELLRNNKDVSKYLPKEIMALVKK